MQIKLSRPEVEAIVSEHIKDVVAIPPDHEVTVTFDGYSYERSAIINIGVPEPKVTRLEAA